MSRATHGGEPDRAPGRTPAPVARSGRRPPNPDTPLAGGEPHPARERAAAPAGTAAATPRGRRARTPGTGAATDPARRPAEPAAPAASAGSAGLAGPAMPAGAAGPADLGEPGEDGRPELRPARTGAPDTGRAAGGTLAFVESPVQLLNVLEWLHAAARRAGPGPHGEHPGAGDGAGTATGAVTVVVLSNNDPMTRGQLRRMAELARDEDVAVRWEDARGGATAPLRTVGSLAPLLRRARRIVIGDPFSRYVQLLLTLAGATELVVVDDGTATMEFVSQLARGERLVRWHRSGGGRGLRGARDAVYAPVSAAARRRLTPREGHRVEVFTSMPVEAPAGVTVTANDFAWTRSRFGPPKLTRGADLVGTSLAETGVVDRERYIAAVARLAGEHGATRYFAHRREDTAKLHRLAEETGLEIVRPELPLELIARRGPIGRTILSFPSTVLHTLPPALAGTGVRVSACDIDPSWLTEGASPRAQGFLAGVTGTARDVIRLPPTPAAEP